MECAIAVADGGPKNFTLESYNRRVVCGYEASREYSFWPLPKFTKELGMTPAQLGSVVETIQDELGKDVQGVMIKDPEAAELKVRVFRRVASGFVTEPIA